MALYAFDGTWNRAKEATEQPKDTNVIRFFRAYDRNSPKGNPEVKNFYVQGVGTRLHVIGAIAGGVFGAGELPRLNEAYDQLCKNWAAGDHVIDIIGFSRGAATTLDFCHLIQERKIRTPGGQTVVEANPQINFVGVWDVVAAFGLANLGLTDLNVGHHLSLPKASLKFAFHALALDERRPSFLPTRLEGAYEVWFRGVHADVGGGNGNHGLNDVTLKWMMSKAKGAGLPIAQQDIDALDPKPATTDPTLHDPAHEFAKVDVRIVTAVDRCHYSVTPKPGCRVPPSTCPIETVTDELRATEIGAGGLLAIPVEVRARVAALAAVAQDTAVQLGWKLGVLDDALASLILARIPLVDTDAKLEQAKVSTVKLVESTVRHAVAHQFHELNEFFVSEAMHELMPLFPYTD